MRPYPEGNHTIEPCRACGAPHGHYASCPALTYAVTPPFRRGPAGLHFESLCDMVNQIAQRVDADVREELAAGADLVSPRICHRCGYHILRGQRVAIHSSGESYHLDRDDCPARALPRLTDEDRGFLRAAWITWDGDHRNEPARPANEG